MTKSAMRYKDLEEAFCSGGYSPIFSRTFLSFSVAAVALLNSTIRHFLPCASFKHSLCIWCASSRVGARIIARTPELASDFALAAGAPRAAMTGRR